MVIHVLFKFSCSKNGLMQLDPEIYIALDHFSLFTNSYLFCVST